MSDQETLYVNTMSIEKPLITEGNHVLTLMSCERKQCKDKFGDDPNGTIEKLLWQFKSNRTDEQQNRYIYEVWTGIRYGHEMAGLTKLLNYLVPGITQAEVNNLNIRTLCNKQYRAKIVHRNNKAGKLVADHVFLDLIEDGGAAKGDATAPFVQTTAPVVAPKDMAWGNDNE